MNNVATAAAGPPEGPDCQFVFGEFVFDERTLELTRAGAVLPMEGKPREALRFLLLHAGEVVSKDELLAGVWTRKVMGDAVLTKCIQRLRDILGDTDQSIIKTVFGYGYRFMPTVHRREVRPVPKRFDFRPGDEVHGRPMWRLVRCLGAGGYGEVWLAQHDKTHDQRVFKFATDGASLAALKREITLFRFLKDSLGSGARVVEVFEWNLTQAPFFLESRYFPAGSLLDWSGEQGRLGALTLDARIDLAIQVAEALGKVHALGVLHKDLKPSNILLAANEAGELTIRLADFGSAGMLDPRKLDLMGISRHGFTQTLSSVADNGGTVRYMSPEALAGQMPTIKADIYSLGVILYQLVIGDFHRPLLTGWEHDVQDPLLREDITDAVQGDVDRRIGDATELAQRLRDREKRRRQKLLETADQERADRAARALDRMKARRVGLIAAFTALVVGLAVSVTMYVQASDARKRTEVAVSESNSVREYLEHDVFDSVSSGKEAPGDITVTQLLTRAGDEIDNRFAQKPEVAARLHFIVGKSLNNFTASAAAVKHFERAMQLSEGNGTRLTEAALESASELIPLDYAMGTLPSHLDAYERMERQAAEQFDIGNPMLGRFRERLARAHFYAGQWTKAAAEYRQMLLDTPTEAPLNRGGSEYWLGRVLIELARFPEAVEQLKAAVTDLYAGAGQEDIEVAAARSFLGDALSQQGDFADAAREFEHALDVGHRWEAPLPSPQSWTVLRINYFKARSAFLQNKPQEAERLLDSILHETDGNHSGEIDPSAPSRGLLADVYDAQGRHDEAIAESRRALEIFEHNAGSKHPDACQARLALVARLMAKGEIAEARTIMSGAAPIDESLPPDHPIRSRYRSLNSQLASLSSSVAQATVAPDTDIRP